MKNFLMCALILCAIPAVAFGQVTIDCTTCSHDVSVYMGSGAVLAETDADKVSFVATCDGVTNSGELTPNDGMVVLEFNDASGLSCHSDKKGNRLQLGPVKDGGWFYINDEMNSAVGHLVAQNLFDADHKPVNTEVMPTDAGDSLTVTEHRGAVYLKHTNGRVGILPTLLPEPMMKPEMAKPCGFQGGPAPKPYTVLNSDCKMGDGGTMIRALGPQDPYTGLNTDGGMVVRPAAGGGVEVRVDLWGNGSGHVVTAYDASGATGKSPRLGHAAAGAPPLALTVNGDDMAKTGGFVATVAQTVGTGTDIPAPTDDPNDRVAGMTFSVANNVGTLTIHPDGAYCNPKAKPAAVNHTAVVTVSAYVHADQENQVTPTIATGTANRLAATKKIHVVCPSASAANMGTELVPENPFPTTE